MATHEMTITDAEVLADFEAALGLDGVVEDPAAMTLEQLGKTWNFSRMAAQKRAEKAVEAGALERVKVRRLRANGRRVLIAYRLVKDDLT